MASRGGWLDLTTSLVETSLSNGPIHFNCFPDFSICLHDSTVIKALTLNIKTHGTLMVQGTSQIALIYRVYYKCMRTNMNVGALDRREKGETTLIQTTDPTAKVGIPKCLKWNEITFL